MIKRERHFASSSTRKGLIPLVVGALAVGGVACGTMAAWKLWVDARNSAQLTAASFGVVFAEQTDRALQPVSLAVQDIRAFLQPSDYTDAEAFLAAAKSADVHSMLVDKVAGIPQAAVLSIVGIHGNVLNTTAPVATAEINVDRSDRDYAAYCRKAAHGSPFIGMTVIGRSSGQKVFPLVYCLDGADGRPLGLILAGVSVSYFMNFYETIGLPPGSSIAVRQPNGEALVRFPTTGPTAPEAMVSTARDDRFVARSRLTGYPLQIEVDFSRATAFDVWRGQVIWIIVAASSIFACLMVLTGQLVGGIKRLDRARLALTRRNAVLLGARRRSEAQARALKRTAEALTESESRLAGQATILETTLEHMNQGLIMVTADRRVAICNRRAMEMLDLPPELMLRKPNFSEVLEHQWQTSEFAFSSADVQRFIRQGGIMDQPQTYERQRPNGEILEVCSQPLEGGGVVRTYTDITLRKQAERRLTYLAYHDELTGLSNRYALREQVGRAIALSGKGVSGPALIYLDLDRFKLVNDTCGHSAGDDILKQVAQRLQKAMRGDDTIARLGGDEFAALLLHGADRDGALANAERIKAAVSGQYTVEDQVFRIGISIGIALYPKDGATTDELLRSADSAVYRAKASGRDSVRLHENAAEAEDVGRMMLEQDLRIAVEQEQFELVYQPIFDIKTGLPVSCEALLRWRHPTRGILSPEVFISMAEETGLIKPLGRWVIRMACAEAATWALPIRVAVNLSPVQLTQPDLELQVLEALAASGLPADRLDLEVTESVLLSNTAQVRGVMNSFESRGIRLVMDDFGTGHSSLEALQGFPFNQIKVDRSFVARVFDEGRAGALLPAILSMAAAMKLDVVVEGVSTTAQLDALRGLGCRYMQGYLLGRPQSPEWIRKYLWQCTTEQIEGAPIAALMT